MSDTLLAQIESSVADCQLPFLGQDPNSAKLIRDAKLVDGVLTLVCQFGFPVTESVTDQLTQTMTPHLTSIDGVKSVTIEAKVNITQHSVQPGLKALPNIKNIIAIASGKGGVGKSTTTVNLALALAKSGARVGILDADIYGPSQTRMLGANQKPVAKDNKKLEPIIARGIQSMSIGYLIDEASPMIWRGPMVSSALTQLLNDTDWDDLDYLLIDMPPGTGDIHLTLAQKVPVSGAVIVTTPQDIALLDARKGLEMFAKVNVPVLGVIENMSYYQCEKCGHEAHIFGQGGGEKLSTETDAELLGHLPLDIAIRKEADGGQPTVMAQPDGPIAEAYTAIALRVAAKLSLMAKDYSTKFPNIVVQND